jgi:hypothetical protein
MNLSPEKQTLLNTFLSNRAKQIKSYGGYGLFETDVTGLSRLALLLMPLGWNYGVECDDYP